jgi:DNA repair protein RecN (Recombination protein N)
MLTALTIRDVILIDRLALAFHPGLCVLTGETGAGKSILLDALGLALGRRAESGLVRSGAAEAAVTAEFALPREHPALRLLGAAGVAAEEGGLVLRRLLAADGRSRAFVNDAPVSVALLRQLGDTLVEVEGEYAERGLFEPANHRAILDAFAGNGEPRALLKEAWRAWQEAQTREREAAAALAASRSQEDLLRHQLAELDAFAPQSGEEDRLAARRSLLRNAERLAEALGEAVAEIDGNAGALAALARATRRLERSRERAAGLLDAAVAACERAVAETAEALVCLERAAESLASDPRELETVEERLFALRALARKHQVGVAELAPLRERLALGLAAIEKGSENAAFLARAREEAREAFIAAAARVSATRREAAQRLDRRVASEFAPLRLGRARFRTVLSPLQEPLWNPEGRERVQFEVSTNPGTPFGPLSKIASRGELARFMLALKLVLAGTSSVPTLIFDEVDSGIGGAVAAAVGERLHRLGASLQILVVTHSPQVAARGAHHWRVRKADGERQVVTHVEELDPERRQEEIARMLSGSVITEEARAAAKSLIALGRA